MMRAAATAALLALVTASVPAFAGDAKAEAKLHVDKATAAHKAGRYTDALGELQLAYTLDPHPDLLYAIAQVNVKLGHCDEAITFYERFLASKPKQAAAEAAHQAIDRCKTAPPPAPLPPPPTPPPTPPPAIHVAEPPPVTVAATSPGHPWYADKLGDTLLVAGVASGVVSIVLYHAARSDLDDADRATTYQAHASLVSSAHGDRTLSLVFGGAGAALALGGVVRYLTHDRRPDAEASGLAIVPLAGGGAVAWGHRF
jgi:tetratricopeptide (TPR) repeat protein